MVEDYGTDLNDKGGEWPALAVSKVGQALLWQDARREGGQGIEVKQQPFHMTGVCLKKRDKTIQNMF